MRPIRFHVNGQLHEVTDAAPTHTLLDTLRAKLGLVGTKEGCAEGDCGACTVAMLDAHAPGGPTWRAVNSCLMLLPMLDGKELITAEGLAPTGRAHPAQDALASELGSQCGYCTPGIVMSMFEATYRDDLDAAWKIDDQLCGNLCRCTGYRPIRDAALAIAGLSPKDAFSEALKAKPEPLESLRYEVGEQRFYRPSTWDELFDLLDAEPEHRFVCGATDLGLDVTKKHKRFARLISLDGIDALRKLEHTDNTWHIGATTRLADLEDATDTALPPMSRMLRFFGSRQIKNSATVGGNLCNASPIGDLAPVLISLGATAIIRSRAGERTVALQDFFTGYRTTVLQPGELLAGIKVSDPPSDARVGSYKVSKRREMDISAVSAGMYVRVSDGIITEARLVYGGMAATTARASSAEAALVGEPWSEDTIHTASLRIDDDFTPMSDQRSSAWFRATVARNLLIGFFEETKDGTTARLPDRPTHTVVLPEVNP